MLWTSSTLGVTSLWSITKGGSAKLIDGKLALDSSSLSHPDFHCKVKYSLKLFSDTFMTEWLLLNGEAPNKQEEQSCHTVCLCRSGTCHSLCPRSKLQIIFTAQIARWDRRVCGQSHHEYSSLLICGRLCLVPHSYRPSPSNLIAMQRTLRV